MRFAGANWIKECGREMSPFGEAVADLIGEWENGIYHLQNEVAKVDWKSKDYIEINYPQSLATFDFNKLTNLVFLAHWFCIRVEVSSCNFRYLKIKFSPRVRDGRLYDRHPTLDGAVESFKKMMSDNIIPEASNG